MKTAGVIFLAGVGIVLVASVIFAAFAMYNAGQQQYSEDAFQLLEDEEQLEFLEEYNRKRAEKGR